MRYSKDSGEKQSSFFFFLYKNFVTLEMPYRNNYF